MRNGRSTFTRCSRRQTARRRFPNRPTCTAGCAGAGTSTSFTIVINVSGLGLTGEVHAARVLEGRAVQDVWIMPRHEDRRDNLDRTMNMYGTTLRSWDGSIQGWRIAWTNPVDGHREEQVGRWNGKDILQEGTRADGTKTRWTFTDIAADSFHWRGEALYPDKQTWVLEGEFLAKRRRS